MNLLKLNQKNVERLLRFDLIRVSKLLEIIQESFISFVLAFFIGNFIDNLFPFPKEKVQQEKISNLTLFKDLSIQVAVVGIASYYIKKISSIFPFIFALTPDFKPNSHNENATGQQLGMQMIFISVQQNLAARLTLFKSRFDT